MPKITLLPDLIYLQSLSSLTEKVKRNKNHVPLDIHRGVSMKFPLSPRNNSTEFANKLTVCIILRTFFPEKAKQKNALPCYYYYLIFFASFLIQISRGCEEEHTLPKIKQRKAS